MSNSFEPNLSVLEPPQRRLWDELGDVPDRFVLCGGTAVALRLGHRISVDFDFFAPEEFDPDELYEEVALLQGSKVIQKAACTLSCEVDRDGPVQVSFYGVPKLWQIEEPSIAADNNVKVASLVDLATMKANVVQKRAEAKDYVDMDAILEEGTIDLPTALAAGQEIYGPSFNAEATLKALSYHGDGNLHTLPQETRDRLVSAVQATELDRLPDFQNRRGRDHDDEEFER